MSPGAAGGRLRANGDDTGAVGSGVVDGGDVVASAGGKNRNAGPAAT